MSGEIHEKSNESKKTYTNYHKKNTILIDLLWIWIIIIIIVA